MKCSETGLWRWLHNSVNIPKTTGVHTLSVSILYCVNYISIRLLKNLCDLGLSKVFLVVTQKQLIKDKLKFIKNENICILNDSNKKVKQQLHRMEKLFAYLADLGKVLYLQLKKKNLTTQW